MAISRYIINVLNHGVVQTAGSSPTSVTLAATGSGSWSPVETHHTIRMGAFAFETGTDVRHVLWVRAQYVQFSGAGTLQFRLQDLTAPATIATASADTFGGKWIFSTTFSNLPSVDSQVELQYTLVLPSTAKFYAGVWEMSRWT